MNEIELDDWDFGFTTHEDNSAEISLAHSKAQEMYDAIMPLLNNLKKDSDTNDLIKWPNRAEKIDQFISRLNDILNK